MAAKLVQRKSVYRGILAVEHLPLQKSPVGGEWLDERKCALG